MRKSDIAEVVMGINVYEEIRIKRIVAVNRLNIFLDECHNRINRPVCGLAFKMKGQTVYTCDGKKHVSNASSSVLLPQSSSYKIHYDDPGECIMAEFILDDGTVLSCGNSLFSVEMKNPEEAHSCAYKLLRMWEKYGECAKTFSALYELLAILSESTSTDYSYSSKSKRNVIKPSVDKLIAEYSNPSLCVSELARESGISDVYFRKIFKECYGMPPAKYLSSLRIKKAKQLLISDGMSIGEAASAVGFSDIYVFSKAFKRIVGIPASEYIRCNSDKVY